MSRNQPSVQIEPASDVGKICFMCKIVIPYGSSTVYSPFKEDLSKYTGVTFLYGERLRGV